MVKSLISRISRGELGNGKESQLGILGFTELVSVVLLHYSFTLSFKFDLRRNFLDEVCSLRPSLQLHSRTFDPGSNHTFVA